MQQVNVVITGRVQGVGFRYWIRHIATRLDVTGTVQNLSDGSVEVIAQSDEDTLRIFVEAISDGPPLAEVKNIEVDWHEPAEKFEGFEIKR